MSWGYIIKLEAELPAAAWEPWLQQTRAGIERPTEWPSADLAGYFRLCTPEAETWRELLAHADWQPAPRCERDGDAARIILTSLLDRSQLEIAGVLPSLLVSLVAAGGSGSLIICSDGSAPEDGWRCQVVDGKLQTTPLGNEEMWSLNEEIAGELAGIG